MPDGSCVYYLHGHPIAEYGDGVLVIRDAGWRTPLTKNRLNGILASFGVRVRIYQSGGLWYLAGGGEGAVLWTGAARVDTKTGEVRCEGDASPIIRRREWYLRAMRYLRRELKNGEAQRCAGRLLREFVASTASRENQLHGVPGAVFFPGMERAFPTDFWVHVVRRHLRRAVLQRPEGVARFVLSKFIESVLLPLERARMSALGDAGAPGLCGRFRDPEECGPGRCPHFGTRACRGTKRFRNLAKFYREVSGVPGRQKLLGCPAGVVCREYRIRGSVVLVGLVRVRGTRGAYRIKCMCVDGRRTVFAVPAEFRAVPARPRLRVQG